MFSKFPITSNLFTYISNKLPFVSDYSGLLCSIFPELKSLEDFLIQLNQSILNSVKEKITNP